MQAKLKTLLENNRSISVIDGKSTQFDSLTMTGPWRDSLKSNLSSFSAAFPNNQSIVTGLNYQEIKAEELKLTPNTTKAYNMHGRID